MDTNILHRKESIILTAISIIDELGIQGLTTREIAKRQEISEGTLFRHFKNKNDIILAVLKNFCKFDSDIIESVKMKNLDFKEAIIFYINSYAEYYNNYPEITSIMIACDVLINEPELADKIIKIYDTRAEFICYLIEEGQRNGELSSHINSENLADVIQGFFRMIIFKWRINKFNFEFKTSVLSALDMVLKAFAE